MALFSFSWHGRSNEKADIEVKTRVSGGGKDYTVINIGDVTLFPTEGQTRELAKALGEYVADLDAAQVKSCACGAYAEGECESCTRLSSTGYEVA